MMTILFYILILTEISYLSGHLFTLRSLSYGVINSDNSVDCSDGVCKLPTNNTSNSSIKTKLNKIEKEINNKTANISSNIYVDEMIKLGYNKNDSLRALTQSNNNIEDAISLLEKEDEDNETLNKLSDELYSKHYWEKDVAIVALKECKLNITEAIKLLEQNEKELQDQFNQSIQELIKNGWDEFIARQALLAQWTLDQRRLQGKNDTIDRKIIESIQPSLHRYNETSKATNKNAKSSDNNKSSQTPPKRAKKEDCIFEVNSQNFHKYVLENKTPVLVDLYADWCGPCKQLGPMLEEAAMKSGGMFHLAKVNVDTNRDIVDTLGATGFPTVFAFNKGKITDRFVGLLPNEELQQFLVRAITGYGERVQTDLNDNDYNDLTTKINYLIGLSSITFKKKEKLFNMLSSIFNDTLAWDNKKNNKLHESINYALIYISKASLDIYNNKYRKINKLNKNYIKYINNHHIAEKLLDIAGFKISINDSNILELSHSNSAILTLVTQKVKEIERQKKFFIKAMPTPSSYPSSIPTQNPTSNIQTNTINVVINYNDQKYTSIIDKYNYLSDLINGLIGNEVIKDTDIIQINNDESNKNILYNAIKSVRIADLLNNKDELIININPIIKRKRLPAKSLHKSKKSNLKDNNEESSTKTYNEYFGGDSTVVQGGDEDDISDSSKYILKVNEDEFKINDDIKNTINNFDDSEVVKD